MRNTKLSGGSLSRPISGVDDGINIGISVLSLNAWRRHFWPFDSYLERLHDWYRRFGKFYQFPTQDLFNTWLGLYPDRYYDLPCEWNVRNTYFFMATKDPCKLNALKGPSQEPFMCPGVLEHGPLALHGAGGHLTDGTPGFADVFESILNLPMRTRENPEENLRQQLPHRLSRAKAVDHRVRFSRYTRLLTLLYDYLSPYTNSTWRKKNSKSKVAVPTCANVSTGPRGLSRRGTDHSSKP
jgi:hypothetical protein